MLQDVAIRSHCEQKYIFLLLITNICSSFQSELLCEPCFNSMAIPRHIEIPIELLSFNLTPKVLVKRCRITPSIQSEHSYTINLQSSEEGSIMPSISSQSQRQSRTSSVSTDSGIDRSPSASRGSQSEFDDDWQASLDTSEIVLTTDSDDDHYEFQPSRHNTRSKRPVKLFDKPEVVAFITIQDEED